MGDTFAAVGKRAPPAGLIFHGQFGRGAWAKIGLFAFRSKFLAPYAKRDAYLPDFCFEGRVSSSNRATCELGFSAAKGTNAASCIELLQTVWHSAPKACVRSGSKILCRQAPLALIASSF